MAESRSLKTDWKRIGRSGPTIDGRNIDPQILLDAAHSYHKDTYAALIWPEHQRWLNYGTVEALKAEKNAAGDVELFATLSPNSWYLETNKQGQRLFFSMELMPNFAKTGKAYLTGLAATDDPASLGTQEMRFSAEEKKAGVVRSNFEESSLGIEKFTNQEEAEVLSLARRLAAFFHKPSQSQPHEDDDMPDKAALEALQSEMKALKEEFSKLKPASSAAPEGEKPEDAITKLKPASSAAPEGEKPEDAITKLSKQVDDLTARFEKLAAPADDKEKDYAAKATNEIIEKLTKQVTDLETKLTAALEEQPGTPGGEHHGNEGQGELKSYV